MLHEECQICRVGSLLEIVELSGVKRDLHDSRIVQAAQEAAPAATPPSLGSLLEQATDCRLRSHTARSYCAPSTPTASER